MSNPFLPPTGQDLLLGAVVAFVRGTIWVSSPGDVPVVRQLVNRAAMPPASPGFVAVGPGRMRRLATNQRTYDDEAGGTLAFFEQGGPPFGAGSFNYPGRPSAGSETLEQSLEYEAAIDCYGAASGDWASALSTLLRSEYGVDNMTVGTPLHADDPVQLPLVDGEEQYEERWRVRLLLEYKPTSAIPMGFADVVTPVQIMLVQGDQRVVSLPEFPGGALLFREQDGRPFGLGLFAL